MSHTIGTGLADLSRELNESTTVTDSKRVGHYNDAVAWFASEKKFPFLRKLNSSFNTNDIASDGGLDISTITDMREPGGIYELYIDGQSNDPYIPIEFDVRNQSRYTNKKFIYLNPTGDTIYFKATPDSNKTIYLWYYFIPARITDTNDTSSTFPIPDRYRKVVATLAAAFVQWSRYLDAKGNLLFNVYQQMVGQVEQQQGERHKGMPKSLQHTLQYKRFKRSYP